jgi:heavy metal translocating P-type ATPase
MQTMEQATSIDPVCGMSVALDAPLQHEHEGVVYRFCAESCLRRFREDPERFVGGAHEARAADPSLANAPHVCPMHPDVRSIGPGRCPKCGMALEPEGAVAGDPFEHEHREMRRRLALAASLTAPLVVLAMGGMLLGHGRHALLPEPANGWVQLVLATLVVFAPGWPILERARDSLRALSANMFTLLGLGILVAWATSVAAVFAPQSGFELNFESAAMVTALALLGQVLELSARRKTGAALRELLELAPPTAIVLDPLGNPREVNLADVREGFVLLVKPGARIPVDGVVLEGEARVDEALLTGEAAPVRKVAGDKVTGGAVAVSGSLKLLAERVGADTTLARIVELVARAQRSRAPVQQLVDRISAWFTPAVIAAAALTLVGWGVLGGEHGWRQGALAAIAVLVIACPCALGLATPMSIVVATARAAREGVLFRDAEALQQLAGVDTLVVDKTGTLTEGKPRVTQVTAGAGFDEARLLALAAAVERRSEHPLANAIVAAARERDLELAALERFESHTGQGASGVVGGLEVLVGNEALLAARGVALDAFGREIELESRAGRSIVLVAAARRLAGWLAIEDPLRADAGLAARQLAADGVEVRMLSGDRRETSEAIARALGIAHFEAQASPERKAAVVAQLKREGRRVAMAGDGVNDAPALAEADVGIAMGSGTDIAKHAAAVTLVRGDLASLAKARALSRATLRNIRQNLGLAFLYNALCIPIAAGALLSPTLAALAMTFSSVSVIANALRLRGVRLAAGRVQSPAS